MSGKLFLYATAVNRPGIIAKLLAVERQVVGKSSEVIKKVIATAAIKAVFPK